MAFAHPISYISAMSTQLIRLESDDPHVAGFAIAFDSGVAKQIAWKADAIISPALDAAKQYTAQVIDSLMREGCEAEIRDTNWVSVTAAVYKIVRDFNGKLHELQGHAETLQ